MQMNTVTYIEQAQPPADVAPVFAVVAMPTRGVANGDTTTGTVFAVLANRKVVGWLRADGVPSGRNILDVAGLRHLVVPDLVQQVAEFVRVRLAQLAKIASPERPSNGPRVLGQWSSTPVAARPFAPRGTPVPA